MDSHTGDIYERPSDPGSAAKEVLSAVDIVSTRLGSDEMWFYFRIELAGPDAKTKGFPYSYGFELDFDDDPAGELLVVVADPSHNVGTRFDTRGVSAYWNQNSNIFGPTAELPDGPMAGDGYEVVAFEGGLNLLSGPRAVADPLMARAAPRGSAVELAVRRSLLDALKLNEAGVDVSGDVNRIGLRPQASRHPIGPSVFTIHDRFGRRESGSPYPFLRLRPVNTSGCPADEKGLSIADREALDSGTDTDTDIANPCYPSGAVAALDNAYYLHTTYTPDELEARPPRLREEPAAATGRRQGPSGLLGVLAGFVGVCGAVVLGWRRRDRRRSAERTSSQSLAEDHGPDP